jgi:hypothetical protein
MQTRTADLFLVDELDQPGRTSALTESELSGLRAVSDWIRSHVIQPHQDLGRSGPVCPYVPGALERKKLWLASEQVGDRDVPEVAQLMTRYQRLFREQEPPGGEDVDRAAIMVVFTDLSADRAAGLFDEVLQQLAAPAYEEDGIVFGPFYPGHPGSAIRNPDFRPFRSPVPFVFVRYGVVGDWPFFLDEEDWFGRYARRFGESAVHALGAELRRLPWRTARD